MNSDITSGTERGHLESESLAKKLAHLTGITRACFLPEDYMICPKKKMQWTEKGGEIPILRWTKLNTSIL